MTKDELTKAVDACIEDMRFVLQTIWDDMPKGQQKQRLKNPIIKAALERYGVEVDK